MLLSIRPRTDFIMPITSRKEVIIEEALVFPKILE